jgi:hypothetical protein
MSSSQLKLTRADFFCAACQTSSRNTKPSIEKTPRGGAVASSVSRTAEFAAPAANDVADRETVEYQIQTSTAAHFRATK